MRHPIDPTVDCVFKALLGSEENRNLLVHFLNAILGGDLPQPVVAVDILNPFHEREFLRGKLSVVDVKARDDRQQQYQVEVQLLNHRDLPAWMNTPQMRQAMSTLTAFSDKERAYDAYQARQNYLREQASIQEELAELRAEREAERAAKEAERAAKEAERAEKDAARQEKEQERQRAEAALAEVERLRALLRARGLDPAD